MYTVHIVASNQPAQTVSDTHPRAAARAIGAAAGSEIVVTTPGTYHRYRVASNGRIVQLAYYSA